MWALKNKLGSIKANAIRAMPCTEDLLRYSSFRRYRYGKMCPFCGAGGSRPVLRIRLTTLRECPGCRLLYVHPRPRPEYLEHYYSTQYKVAGSEWEEIRKLDLSRLPESIYGRTREISLVSEIKRGGTLLDIGCSWGFLMLQARDMGFTVKGVEVGRPYADYAREKLKLDVFPGHLEKAGFPTEYFDAIIGVHVLEHLPDLKTSFIEIRRILKEDGVAVFIVPNFESATREIKGTAWEWLDIRNHYYQLTRPFFERALKPLGFDLSFRSEEGHFGMNFLKERFSDAEIRDIHHTLKGSELIVTAKKLPPPHRGERLCRRAPPGNEKQIEYYPAMLAKIIKTILQIAGKPRVKTFKHGGNMGDIIYSLPTIIALGGGKLYISKGTPYMGQLMTDATVSQMSELLKTQSYITDVSPFQGEKIDYDLDKFREHNMNRNLLSVCHLRSFGVTFDLSQPWLLNITPNHIAEIVINRTMRYVGEDPHWPTLYHGEAIEWGALKGYESRCAFVGFDEEYSAFKKETGLDIAKYEIRSALEFARIIRGSSLYIGNQSFGYALAEAMKHPRILEVCPYAPNCMPQSSNGHVELTGEIIEEYLGKQAEGPSVQIGC